MEKQMEYVLMADFTHSHFQAAFKQYFEEFEIQISDWESFFEQMNTQEGNLGILIFEKEAVLAFLLFRFDELTHWFFKERVSFVREFWVTSALRNKGLGSELLSYSETYFKKNHVHKILLTSNSAEPFYIKNGFRIDKSYTANNEEDVYVKII